MPRAAMPFWDPERLRRIRAERGLTMIALAARADLEYGQVKRYSLGLATPPPHALVQLARALGVPTTELAPLSTDPDLSEYRWHAGLQIDELAQRVDLSAAYVGEIVRGAGRISDPQRWADALGITTEQLHAAAASSRRRLRGEDGTTDDGGQ